MKNEKKGEITKRKMLNAGVKLWPHVTARAIANELEMTHPTVAYHFGDNSDLCNAVAEYAVQIGNSRVIAQLIATKHRAVRKMPALERQKHMDAAS